MTTIAPGHVSGGIAYHIRDDCRWNPIEGQRLEGTGRLRACHNCLYILVGEQSQDEINRLVTSLLEQIGR